MKHFLYCWLPLDPIIESGFGTDLLGSGLGMVRSLSTDSIVLQLKLAVKKASPDGIEPKLQRLIYKGKVSTDEQQIAEPPYNMKDQHIVILVKSRPKHAVLPNQPSATNTSNNNASNINNTNNTTAPNSNNDNNAASNNSPNTNAMGNFMGMFGGHARPRGTGTGHARATRDGRHGCVE